MPRYDACNLGLHISATSGYLASAHRASHFVPFPSTPYRIQRIQRGRVRQWLIKARMTAHGKRPLFGARRRLT